MSDTPTAHAPNYMDLSYADSVNQIFCCCICICFITAINSKVACHLVDRYNQNQIYNISTKSFRTKDFVNIH